MEKYLYFQTANDDAAMYPASRLLAVEHGGDTALLFKFIGSSQDTTVEEDNVDVVTCVITTQKEKEVMKAVADAIGAPGIVGNKSFIVIADDVNSEYIHADLTSLGTIVQDS